MGAPFKNRMLTVSVALAASGIMTCGVALSDIFLPRGSAVLCAGLDPAVGRNRVGRVDRLRLDLRMVGPARSASCRRTEGTHKMQPRTGRQHAQSEPGFKPRATAGPEDFVAVAASDRLSA